MDWLTAHLSHLSYLAISVALLTWGNLVLGAYLAYRQDRTCDGTRTFFGFLCYLFPRKVLLHRSAFTDYMFVFLQKLTYPVIVAPAIALLYVVGHASASVLEHWLPAPALDSGSFWASMAFSVIGLTLAADFGDFLTHRTMHRVWWLWEFHKIHHSAEVMTLGLTGRRNHPVEEILRDGSSVVCAGIIFGIFAYAFGVSVDAVAFYGVDTFLVLKLLGFYHLQHSHLHLRYGPVLERILVSPAQHQLHHSVDPAHYDTNFGTLISIWDILFKSWRRSEPVGGFSYGLADGEAYEYRSIARLYAMPFIKIYQGIRSRRAARVASNDLDPITSPTERAA